MMSQMEEAKAKKEKCWENCANDDFGYACGVYGSASINGQHYSEYCHKCPFFEECEEIE